MSINRYAAKTDKNQSEIVQALRNAGCDVYYIKQPVDLAVGRASKTYLLEVKAPKAKGQQAGKPTDKQKEFLANWRGHVAVVHTIEEALKAVGLSNEGADKTWYNADFYVMNADGTIKK